MKITVEQYVQKKEIIAGIIFDYEYGQVEARPHEEDCNYIADEIMQYLGFDTTG